MLTPVAVFASVSAFLVLAAHCTDAAQEPEVETGRSTLRHLKQSQTLQTVTDVDCQRYPYLASLQDEFRQEICAGALVHSRFILTSADCVADLSTDEKIQIAIGGCNIIEGTEAETILVDEITVHPGFSDVLLGFDIALLRLSSPASGIPMKLPEVFTDVSGVDPLVTLATGVGDSDQSQSLQVDVEHTVVPLQDCQEVWMQVVDSMLCINGTEGSQVCGGTKGGPLVQSAALDGDIFAGSPEDDIVVGVASTPFNTIFCSFLPSIFTMTSSFVEWISAEIESEGFEIRSAPSVLPPATPPIPVLMEPPSSAPSQAPAPSDVPTLDQIEDSPAPIPAASSEGSTPAECSCSVDGRSGNANTKIPQCHVRTPLGIPICYVTEIGCQGAITSYIFPGAAWMPCKNIVPRPTSSEITEIERSSRLKTEEKQLQFNQNLLELANAPPDSSAERQVRRLLKRGADPNFCCLQSDGGLHLASRSGNDIVATALIEWGADVDAEDSIGRTPLHTAVISNTTSVAAVLISVVSNVNPRDDVGGTPLHHASFLNLTVLVQMLVEREGDPNAGDQVGDTPLHWAASNNGVAAAMVLIDAGADVNGRNRAGETALHLAAKRGFVKMAEFLVQLGTDKSVTDNAGNTASDDICQTIQDCPPDVVEGLERVLS